MNKDTPICLDCGQGILGYGHGFRAPQRCSKCKAVKKRGDGLCTICKKPLFIKRYARRPPRKCSDCLRTKLTTPEALDRQGRPPTYGDRNHALEKMGYADYDAYLASPLWESIKRRAWSQHGRRCRLCSRDAEVLHHLGYGEDVLKGIALHQLVPLCHGCHRRVEFKKDKKRTLAEALTAYQRIWRMVKHKANWTGQVDGLYGRCIACGKPAKKRANLCRPCQKAGESATRSDEPLTLADKLAALIVRQPN